jgi:uncharacterized protein (DUF58 family)
MADVAERRKDYFDPQVLTRIARLELRARQVVEGFISGMHESPFKGFSIEFADHREYSPGDDLRHIDWRVYARADRFYVKEYEVETNLRAHLLLDCSESMAYPEHDRQRMSKWDYAATLAVAMAHLLVVEQSDAAGIVLFDEAIRHQGRISANRAALGDLVGAVEACRPQGGTNVKMPFAELAEHVPRRGLVVVMSDLLTNLGDIIEGLDRFRAQRHDVLVLHVLDRDEIEFPFTDRTQFEGMEGLNRHVLTDPQSLRASYCEAVQAFIDSLKSACLERRVDYALINTSDPLDRALSTFLASRMHQMRTRK